MTTNPTIDPSALYWATFNRFELRLPGQSVIDCSHSGSRAADVAHWAPQVAEGMKYVGLNLPTPDSIRAELKEYGAWDADELADDAANWQRIVWLAAVGIADSDSPDCSEPVKGGAQ